MLTGKFIELHKRLTSVIPKDRLLHDPMSTLAYGTDASFYRMIPQLVVRAKNEEEVSVVLKECSSLRLPVTIRAAGTSLSGQAVTDSVLLVTGGDWNKYTIEEGGNLITLQPGITGGKANRILLPYAKKIGPDPASVNSAMIGGIIANNASGMCCGVSQNSYRTIAGMMIVLADGTTLDTKDRESRRRFSETHGQMLLQIDELARKTREDTALNDRIRKKYKIKNTTGYSLNALTDFADPFDIIEHLIVGSEGTLAFISQVTYKTVVEHAHRASSLIIFSDIAEACKAVIKISSEEISAAELIDRNGLTAVEDLKGIPPYIRSLARSNCALLIEITAADINELKSKIDSLKEALSGCKTINDISFTSIPEEYEQLWKIRKGLFPSVGAMRARGTTVIIEDIAFPLSLLADATTDLRTVLDSHGYREAVIFGHALAGNLHFVFSQDFSNEAEINRYAALIDDVTELVVHKYDGSLKAEHGTGRNMAPFVEIEWGKQAYGIMKRIKSIFDPDNILNPGVILNDDNKIHLKNLKQYPVIEETADKCTECGFCESSCVSSGFTLSPRQRIAVYRAIQQGLKDGREPHITASISQSFSYSGEATCATDGLCAIACPVGIDTGKLIKKIRADKIGTNTKTAAWIANRFAFFTSAVGAILSVAAFAHSLFGTRMMSLIAGGMRTISGGKIPAWNKHLPGRAKRTTKTNGQVISSKKVVYFPCCINRTMGVSKDYGTDKQLSIKVEELLTGCGYEIIYPDRLNDLCCGMAFSSKGYFEAGKRKSDQMMGSLREASNNGQIPILCDMSPCSYTMKENSGDDLKIYDISEFIYDNLLPDLNLVKTDETVAVFPVCSTRKMGTDVKLIELAKLCASEVIIPDTNCCGFAGDRGFTFPELNRFGLKELKEELPEKVKYGYSSSRTCEIGLSLHSGRSFRSIVYLVEKASKNAGSKKD